MTTVASEKKWKCEGAHRAGPAWAVLDADEAAIITVRTQWAPAGTDYAKFRADTLKELEALGKIRVGRVVYEQGACWFVRTHTRNHKMNLDTARKVKSEYVKGSGRHLAALNPTGTKLLGAFPARAPAETPQDVWTAQITAQLSQLGRVQLGTMKREEDDFYFYWQEQKGGNPGRKGHGAPTSQGAR